MPTPGTALLLTIVLAIQAKTGGNLAEALGNLSAVLRARKLMREKIKALSSEATTSAFIIGSLPVCVSLMITITTPSYMAIMYTDPRKADAGGRRPCGAVRHLGHAPHDQFQVLGRADDGFQRSPAF